MTQNPHAPNDENALHDSQSACANSQHALINSKSAPSNSQTALLKAQFARTKLPQRIAPTHNPHASALCMNCPTQNPRAQTLKMHCTTHISRVPDSQNTLHRLMVHLHTITKTHYVNSQSARTNPQSASLRLVVCTYPTGLCTYQPRFHMHPISEISPRNLIPYPPLSRRYINSRSTQH
jgi:hypothetical protein